MNNKLVYALLVEMICVPMMASAVESTAQTDDISALRNLANIVTSVSKEPEDSFRSAAAIYVISNEDIKLSGATHIAEVLRGVPGLNVSQIDSSNWAISSRGFNGEFSNKLLVLVDGRTIYTPLFSGVYWDIQNIPLADIERVEVIRGPGAALWGSNAVNGVINIITKSAADTQGVLATTLTGTQDRSISDVRYGGKLGEDFYYRAYGKYDNVKSTPLKDRGNGENAWTNGKTGFRTDFKTADGSKATIQGDAYNADIDLNLSVPSFTTASGYDSYHDKINSRGTNILGRLETKHNDTMQSTFQTYVDYQSPSYTLLKQEIYTFDFDYQTNWKASKIHNITWGAGAREIAANLTSSESIIINNQHESQHIYSGFLQDQIAVIPQEVYVTLGSKFEQNSYAGFVPEPSARISWYPDDKQTLWAAVSHAVRTPSISERTGKLNQALYAPGVIAQIQPDDFKSEELTAYEVGYRIKPIQKLSIDSTAFVNEYNKLQTFEPGNLQTAPLGYILPLTTSNLGKGHAYGFETSAKWDVLSNWNLSANYSYINLILDQGSSQDSTFVSQKGQTPHNQFMVRSQLFLPYDIQLINTAYYVDELTTSSVNEYLRFDTQIIWKAMSGLELALVGQNMFDRQHTEFGSPLNGSVNEIPEAYYLKATIRY